MLLKVLFNQLMLKSTSNKIKKSSFYTKNIIAMLIIILNMLLSLFNNNVLATVMSSFDRTSENVTIIIGNSVVLPCFISNLGDHKVSLISLLIL